MGCTWINSLFNQLAETGKQASQPQLFQVHSMTSLLALSLLVIQNRWAVLVKTTGTFKGTESKWFVDKLMHEDRLEFMRHRIISIMKGFVWIQIASDTEACMFAKIVNTKSTLKKNGKKNEINVELFMIVFGKFVENVVSSASKSNKEVLCNFFWLVFISVCM